MDDLMCRKCGQPVSDYPPFFASGPWDAGWWKPSDNPMRNLIKALARYAAEMDRLQRRSGDDPTYREWLSGQKENQHE